MTKKLLSIFILFIVSRAALKAQMPHDAIYMPKKTICVAVSYSNNSWKQYWENTLKRDNANMGTHTIQSFIPMAAIGISDKLNAIIALPYMSTSTSAGNLRGQRGLQDASAWLKYKALEKNGFSAHGVLGASVPVGNYLPDFLPMSLGLQTKTLSGKLLANYTHKSGIYATAHATYILRSNIKIDRDAYQAYEKIINSDIVAIPNVTDAAARIGYLKKGIQTEVFIENFACVGGDNIRRNDMPFPTNNMKANAIGFYGKYQPKNIGGNIRVSQVVSGLNVGQTFSISAGFLYQINFNKN